MAMKKLSAVLVMVLLLLEWHMACLRQTIHFRTICLRDGPWFSNTGINFADSLCFKEASTVDKQIKVCACLYTCASTRAVHFELTKKLSAVAFLRSFQKSEESQLC